MFSTCYTCRLVYFTNFQWYILWDPTMEQYCWYSNNLHIITIRFINKLKLESICDKKENNTCSAIFYIEGMSVHLNIKSIFRNGRQFVWHLVIHGGQNRRAAERLLPRRPLLLTAGDCFRHAGGDHWESYGPLRFWWGFFPFLIIKFRLAVPRKPTVQSSLG